MSDTKATTTTGIAYDDSGRGSLTFLCLPGWCGPRTVFDPLVPALAEEHRVLALDWRGHGESAAADGDFGFSELVDDAISVMDERRVSTAVPVALSHAGWAAIELRRRLGPERVPKMVLLDWMVLGAPAPFRDALAAMQAPDATRRVVDQIIAMWTAGIDLAELRAYLEQMAAAPDEMWQRAARHISAAFDASPSPLQAIGSLDPPPSTLHVYAQPADPAVLDAQRDFAADHPWFTVEHLQARSHFPMFEAAEALAVSIRRFAE